MFRRLFRKTYSDNLSKSEYWKKWELPELFDDLHKAEKLLADATTDITHIDLLNFKNEFVEELYEIEGDNVADFTGIWEWFTPKKEWETLIGQPGKAVGENIFRITDRWKRNQDFLKGTKVFLKNEFGVILDKTPDNDMYGLIRWDTEKENDTEDWRGLFGVFLQEGGQVISQDHEFRFINDDGGKKVSSKS